MDTNTTHEHGCESCHGHGMIGDMCGHRHWRHIIIKVLVAIFIFWCGVQFGELKALIHSYTGYGMMGWSQQGGQEYSQFPSMMYGYGYNNVYGTPTQVRTMMGTTTLIK